MVFAAFNLQQTTVNKWVSCFIFFNIVNPQLWITNLNFSLHCTNSMKGIIRFRHLNEFQSSNSKMLLFKESQGDFIHCSRSLTKYSMYIITYGNVWLLLARTIPSWKHFQQICAKYINTSRISPHRWTCKSCYKIRNFEMVKNFNPRLTIGDKISSKV